VSGEVVRLCGRLLVRLAGSRACERRELGAGGVDGGSDIQSLAHQRLGAQDHGGVIERPGIERRTGEFRESDDERLMGGDAGTPVTASRRGQQVAGDLSHAKPLR
jgi:hypothetical protein